MKTHFVCLVLGLILVTPASGQFLKFLDETPGFQTGFESPQEQIFSADGKFFYVSGGVGLGVFDYNDMTAKFEVIDVIRLGNFGIYDYYFRSLELSADEKYVYAMAISTYSDAQFASRAFVFSRNAVTGRLAYVADYSLDQNLWINGDMKLSPDFKDLYVTGFGIGIRDYAVDPGTGTLILKGLTGNGDGGNNGPLWISSDAKYVYSKNNFYSRDLSNGSLTFQGSNNSIPPGKITSTKDETLLFIPAEPGIAIIGRDAVTGALTRLGTQKNLVSAGTYGPVNIGGLFVSGDDQFLHVTAKYNGNLTSYKIDKVGGILTLINTIDDASFSDCAPPLVVGSGSSNFVFALPCTEVETYVQDANGVLNFVNKVISYRSLDRGLSGIIASVLSGNGRFLYILSVTDSSLSSYDTEAPGGKPEQVKRIRASELGKQLLGRELTLSPDNSFIYEINEATSSILAFKTDPLTGIFEYSGEELLPETIQPYETDCHLRISPNGKFAYVISGGHSVKIYSRDTTTGALAFVNAVQQANGANLNNVRSIAISADGRNLYLIADDVFVSYTLDSSTGLLDDAQVKPGNCAVLCSLNSEVLVTKDGTNLHVLSRYGGYPGMILRVFQRNLVTGAIDWTPLAPLEKSSYPSESYPDDGTQMSHYALSYNQDYILSTGLDNSDTEMMVRLHKRDKLDSGRIIYLGKQRLPYLPPYDPTVTNYWVKPDNKTIVVVESGSLLIYTLETNIPPSPPVMVRAKSEIGKIALSWRPNFEANIASYEVYGGITQGSQYAHFIAATVDTTFNYVPGDFTGGYFWIKAKNADGVLSEFSAPAGAIALNPAPGHPVNLQAEGGDLQVVLSWSANPEFYLRKYHVYRSITNDSLTALILSMTTQPSYTDFSVTYGTTYFYWLKAEGDAGLISSFSQPASGSPLDFAPASPHDFVVFVDQRSANLFWAGNSEGDLKRYNVYKSSVQDFSTSVPLTHTDFLYYGEADLADGTYYYWLSAEDGNGNESSPAGPVSAVIDQDPSRPDTVTAISKDGSYFGVHPNPATVTLTIDGPASATYSYEIIDAVGRVQMQGTVTLELDVSALRSGLYLIRLSTRNSEGHFRFVKGDR